MGGRRMAVHTVERRDNEPADTDQAVRQILEETQLEAPQAPQPVAHIGDAPAVRRDKHPTGAAAPRTLRA